MSPSPEHAPRISVVIVSWNRRADLEVAIRSVRAQQHGDYELIIVDNGSTDGTIEMLEGGALGALTLYKAGANLGASVARNLGLRLARGQWVAFMDSDAELLGTDIFTHLERQLEADPKLGALGLAIYLDRERSQPWALGNYHLPGGYVDLGRARSEWAEPHYLNTCFSLWRREAVAALGGFDPAMPYGFEDNDLSLRLRRAGWHLAVDPSRAACHHLSKAARIRAESDGWSHFAYDERSRALVQLKDLGLVGFLRQEAWLCSRAGRLQRHYIHLHSGLRRRQKLRLYTLEPLRAMLGHLGRTLTGRVGDFIAQAPFEPGKVCPVVPSRQEPAKAG